jgi:hypothetical protein
VSVKVIAVACVYLVLAVGLHHVGRSERNGLGPAVLDGVFVVGDWPLEAVKGRSLRGVRGQCVLSGLQYSWSGGPLCFLCSRQCQWWASSRRSLVICLRKQNDLRHPHLRSLATRETYGAVLPLLCPLL